MSRAVWKHTFTLDRVEVPVSGQSRVVLVAWQHGRPQLWIDDERNDQAAGPRYHATFVLVGTGLPVPAGAVHVGSFLTDGGSFVFHCYEVQP